MEVTGGNPNEEEVAAILAAVSVITARRRVAVPPAPARVPGWVRTSRLVARRETMQRGSWRLSGRLPRRTRA